jgi:hypothetical protein
LDQGKISLGNSITALARVAWLRFAHACIIGPAPVVAAVIKGKVGVGPSTCTGDKSCGGRATYRQGISGGVGTVHLEEEFVIGKF